MLRMDLSLAQVAPIQKKLYQQKAVRLQVLRLDAIHPVISGNKWFKLKEYIKEAQALNKQMVVTFGGAYSNHIIATAAACHHAGLQCAGIIRGEQPPQLSHTLQQAQDYGMQFHFASRHAYAQKWIPEALLQNRNEIYLIPEGGYGAKGALGASSIAELIDRTAYTHICAAAGTGTMLAGLCLAAEKDQYLVGISVLKNFLLLEEEVRKLAPHTKGILNILHHYHFGGYAKKTSELLQFMNEWYTQTGIPTDFVYTAKLFYAIDNLIGQNYFSPGASVLAIHSGGLQGNASLPKGTLIF